MPLCHLESALSFFRGALDEHGNRPGPQIRADIPQRILSPQAMFDDPDWYLPRREDEDDETGVVRVDLSHLRADVLDIVLESIYTDSERNLFREHGKHGCHFRAISGKTANPIHCL